MMKEYRPVIGGVRHRTGKPRPHEGQIVQTLCGALYKVGVAAKSEPEKDCPTCEDSR